MPGSWSPQEFPNLTDKNSVITSPKQNGYNCIAWAVGDTERWWWPFPAGGVAYWPKGIRREATIEAFIAAFGTQGFIPCADGELQDGVEKIALYARILGSQLVPTHAARQLESGEWTSKLGPLEDIRHTNRNAVDGPLYGETVRFLARPRTRPPVA